MQMRAQILLLLSQCKWECAKDISAESFSAWRSERQDKHGVSAKTLNEYLGAIRSLLNWMVKRNRISDNPLRIVEMLPTYGEQVEPRRAFTDEELERLFAAAGDRRVVYLIAVRTGLRNGEIRALQAGDVSLDDGEPRISARAITTKNGKAAVIPLCSDTAQVLRDHIKKHALSPSDSLFECVFSKRRQFLADLMAAGIPSVDKNGYHLDFHSLRHTFCTHLQREGATQRVLMELMRHSDRRLSDYLYTDMALLPVREAVEKLPSYGCELPHILPHELVPESPVASQQDTNDERDNPPGSGFNKASGHDQSVEVPQSPNVVMVRGTGFEPVAPTVSRFCSRICND